MRWPCGVCLRELLELELNGSGRKPHSPGIKLSRSNPQIMYWLGRVPAAGGPICTIKYPIVRSMPPREAGDALADDQRSGVGATVGLIERATSPNTRRAYTMARRQLDAWLDGRPLDDSSITAYLGHLHEAGRAPATAAMVVAAVKRAARDAGTAAPIGPLTRHALEGFRRTGAADAPSRRGQARGLTAHECAIVLATCLHPRRTGRGLERPKTAERRGLVDGAIVALLFHGALRRSEVAALCWADVDFSDGADVVVTVRRSKSDPTGGRADVRRLVGGCAAAIRSLPRRGLTSTGRFRRRPRCRPDQPPLRHRLRRRRPREPQDCRTAAASVSPSSSPPAGLPPTPSRKDPAMVVRYAASVSTREGAVSKYLRSSEGSDRLAGARPTGQPIDEI